MLFLRVCLSPRLHLNLKAEPREARRRTSGAEGGAVFTLRERKPRLQG